MNLSKVISSVIAVFFALHANWVLALAEEEAKSSMTVGSSVAQPSEYFGQIILSLTLVILIIFFSAWLLRRYGRFPGVADGNLKVLGALSVGQRERILLLQVGKEQVLVGVTSSRITRLHQLEEPVEVAHNEAISSPFAKRLQEALMASKPADKTADKSDSNKSNKNGPDSSESH